MSSKRKPKILIIGHGRHGKDSVAELMARKMNLRFESSSVFVGERAVWPNWGKDKYKTFEECFEDRVNHRTTWGNLIAEYNEKDPSRTGREMLEAGNHIYVGLRRRREFESVKKDKLFDYVVWVDACKRLPKESLESMELTKEDADYTIDNNDTLDDLPGFVEEFILGLSTQGFDVDPESEG